ncbi:MAG: hypothetical protein WDA11_12595 [Thiohalomonadaceae bacterium]
MAGVQNDGAHVFTPLGIRPVDEVLPGLVSGGFNLLEAPDATAADVALAHFLDHALKRGARVAVVAFDEAQWRLLQFANYGFDFCEAMDDDRLSYVYYRPTLSRALGGGADYGALFNELRRLTGPVERIGFLTPEVMFNLETDALARDSVGRFASSAGKLGATALGVYVPDDSAGQARLRTMGARLFAGAYEMKPVPGNSDVALRSLKGALPASVRLSLLEGRGYVAAGGYASEVA